MPSIRSTDRRAIRRDREGAVFGLGSPSCVVSVGADYLEDLAEGDPVARPASKQLQHFQDVLGLCRFNGQSAGTGQVHLANGTPEPSMLYWLTGEWPGGISPPGSLRTGRHSLPSSGPHRPTGSESDKLRMGDKVPLG